MARDQNLLKDGKFDQGKVLDFFDKSEVQEPWKVVIKKSIVECIAKTSSKLEELKKLFAAIPNNSNAAECNVQVMTTIECTMHDMFANCPAPFNSKNKTCTDDRAFLDKCNANIENTILVYLKKVRH